MLLSFEGGIKRLKGGHMIRKGLFITEQQQEKLKKESEKRGVSESEVVRNAIDKYFEEEK